MQIRDLERSLGVDLVERRGSGVALTPVGEEIARRAEAILGQVRDLADFARAQQGVLCGSLRLGIIPSIAPYLLPAVLPLLHERHPRLDLLVRETQTAAIVEELLRGDLDCAVIALPWSHPQIEELPLFEDEFLLAVRPEEAPRWREETMQVELQSARLLLLEEGHCLRDQALQFCRLADPVARRSLGATSLATIVQMVAAGYGVTLLPKLCAEAEVRDDRVALLPFGRPAPKREVGLAWRASSPRRADFLALAEIVRAARPAQEGEA
jgi:LysR family hydrogen peroxide-inducible transcriptional activator